MEKYSEAASKIVQAQKNVMGPLAVELAKRVNGLVFTDSEVSIQSDPKEALTVLVESYKSLFGDASLLVSREAIKSLESKFSEGELPSLLK